jgi:hypothetical protein
MTNIRENKNTWLVTRDVLNSPARQNLGGSNLPADKVSETASAMACAVALTG